MIKSRVHKSMISDNRHLENRKLRYLHNGLTDFLLNETDVSSFICLRPNSSLTAKQLMRIC